MNFATSIKAVLLQLITIVLAYFSPVKGLIHGVAFLFVADWLLGISASLKSKRRLTSYRFRKSANKALGYLSLILTTFVAQEVFFPEWLNLTNVVAGYIAFVELISIFENTAHLTGKDFIADLIKILKNQVNKYLK